MFDALCALLLRLYPAGFRRDYGREAIQLVRDRARDERGAFRRARLLMDLAIDICATRLRGWQPAQPAIARIDGAPRFDIIDIEGPRPGALAAGTLTSIVLFASFVLLFQPWSAPTPTLPAGAWGSATPGVESKKATLVGETTAGHQHSGAFRRINDHFGMGIQESARPDNPYPVKGWEVIGVEPDVMASQSEALRIARELAERRQSTR